MGLLLDNGIAHARPFRGYFARGAQGKKNRVRKISSGHAVIITVIMQAMPTWLL